MDMPESARTSQAERNAINEGKDSAFTFESLAQFRDAWKGRLVVKGLQWEARPLAMWPR